MGTQRSNLIYRLRQKGFKIGTDARTVYVNNIKLADCRKIRRLRSAFGFKVQLVFEF